MYIMNYFLLPEINKNITTKNIELQYNNADEINIYLSKTLHTYLNNLKKEIDKYPTEWDNVKKYTNTYEFIHTNVPNYKYSISKLKPISRSFYKMVELCNIFNILDKYKFNNIKSFHIAEGPGGFIEALNHMRNNDKDIYYGMTLINDDPNVPGWNKTKHFLNNNSNKVRLEYGKDNTGNILHKENLQYCYDKYNNNFDIITADGGFDFSVDFNMQENMAINLIFAEVCFAIATQKLGGNFILKIFDFFSKSTIDILYFLCLFYEKVYIVKPYTSRLANSEKYIICLNFKKIENYQEVMNKIIENYDNLKNEKRLSSFLNNYESLFFINKLEEINAILGQQQMENISYTLSLLYKKTNNTVKYEQLKSSNIQKCIQWCGKNNIPHNNIQINNISDNFFLRKRSNSISVDINEEIQEEIKT